MDRFRIRGLSGALAAALCLGLAPSTRAWSQPQWVRQLGTSKDDVSYAVATDRSGNVYITGSTDGSLGGANQGGSDAFVAKYSAAGALLWIRQLGTPDWDTAQGIATGEKGNVYIAGETWGSLGGPTGGNGRLDCEVFSGRCPPLETATRNGGQR